MEHEGGPGVPGEYRPLQMGDQGYAAGKRAD